MKSAVLSTNMSVFILKTGRKSLIFIGFPRDIGCQFRRQFTERHARCLNPFQTAMYIAVHGGLDVRMARNRLQSFDIRARRLHYGEIGMSKDMRRCAMKVNGFSNALPCPVKGAFRDRRIPIAHNKKVILFWVQIRAQFLHHRD